MRQLGIPEHQIGAADHERGSGRCVFSPEETRGGTVDHYGRLYMDSGFLNPELAEQYRPQASAAWKKASARNRIDAIIAYESAEASGVSHAEAIQRAVDTALPISDHARRILLTIAEAEKRPGGR